MTEDPPGTFDRDAQKRAWKAVLSPDRPIRYFFIPVARSDLGWDLYVHFMPTEDPGQVWRGYLWADAAKLLSTLFPGIIWTDDAIQCLSREVCGQVFTVVKPASDTLLFGLPEMEDNLPGDGSESIVLIPCDEYNMPHILYCVAKVYGGEQPCLFRTIEYRRLESDYKRLEEVDDQHIADFQEMRAQCDGTNKRFGKAQRRNRRYVGIITAMVSINIIGVIALIAVLLIHH